MIQLQDSIKLNRMDGNQISGNQKPLLIHSGPYKKISLLLTMLKEDIIKISAFSAGWSWYHDLKLKSKLTVECLLGHYPTLSMRDNPSENWSSKNKPWSGFNILRGGTHRSEHYVYWHSSPLGQIYLELDQCSPDQTQCHQKLSVVSPSLITSMPLVFESQER